MPRATTLSAYPGKCVIRRAVENARELGLDVAAIEVAPGGVIRILTPAAFAQAPKDDFEALVQEGKL
jgi:hypothetical protein